MRSCGAVRITTFRGGREGSVVILRRLPQTLASLWLISALVSVHIFRGEKELSGDLRRGDILRYRNTTAGTSPTAFPPTGPS